MRSRPRTVMRSAAPGPAPMKWTVMGASDRCRDCRASAQVAPPLAMRGRARRLSGPATASAAASASEPTPRRLSIRAERVTTRASEASRAAGSTGQGDRPNAAAAAADGGLAGAVGRGRDGGESRAVEPGLVERTGDQRRDLVRRRYAGRNPIPATRRARSWLRPGPLRHRHRRPPAVQAADRAGPVDRIAPQAAAMLRRRRPAGRPRPEASPRWRRSARPAGAQPAPPAGGPARETPPPMKTASGAGRPASASGAVPVTTVRSGTPRACGVPRDALGPVGMRLDRGGAQARMAQHPLDCDRARAGADVPQVLARMRAEGREGQGADLGLGELPVILEQASSRPGASGDGCGRSPATAIATVLSGSIVAEVEAVAPGSSRMRSRGPPMASQHRDRARRRSRARRAAPRARPASSRPRTGRARRAPGWMMRTIRRERPAVQRDAGRIRPAASRAGRRRG